MDRMTADHDRDFFAWTQAQAEALREAAEARVNLPIDWANIADEVEGMGLSQRSAVKSAMRVIIEHLLKLEHSPAAYPRRGWMESVAEHRTRIEQDLDDSPSLRSQLDAFLDGAWTGARRKAVLGLGQDGIGKDDLPQDCPYVLAAILDHDWWPENRHGAE